MKTLWWVAAAALGLSACDRPAEHLWSGYVEGDYVYVASPIGGALAQLSVRRGQQIDKGAPLFTLDSTAERAAREEAAARERSARAQAANTDKGRRSDEIAVTQAQLAQARAQATLAASELARTRQLVAQGFVSPSKLDDASAAEQQALARVGELQAALRVARLPARSDERAAADAQADAARSALAQQQWREAQKSQRAPTAGQVADTFFRVGEWVNAGQPVVSLLAPGAVRARFYVPEAELGTLKVGQAVELRCDGCGAPIAARIDFIATQAEYTPPVIYSNAQRSRLVFLVEARPEPNDGARLKPGQPLDVKALAGT
ncbi:MAG: HlyD family efflux transporter periplasmic adaptor subunit [Aquincola sp.]|nr:HlyD family efflux transporter periplasmic adaptor subunit [Aquincola sp.]MDH4287782.1 HlyD family efflux transporter periplasmic adaptor subunit [Aquincola sp.]MDH5328434.1 HlyD family efflux transporter periplasmic adaptor subunit [Aquincola sp.]